MGTEDRIEARGANILFIGEILRRVVGMTDAEKCRKEGWGLGTQLVGDDGHGPTVIKITAVGEEGILARAISYNGEPCDRREGRWTLAFRDWQPVE